jgi:hypothetical protein
MQPAPAGILSTLQTALAPERTESEPQKKKALRCVIIRAACKKNPCDAEL